MDEREYAVKLANTILDQPSPDTDDDLSVLARQVLQAQEALNFVTNHETTAEIEGRAEQQLDTACNSMIIMVRAAIGQIGPPS